MKAATMAVSTEDAMTGIVIGAEHNVIDITTIKSEETCSSTTKIAQGAILPTARDIKTVKPEEEFILIRWDLIYFFYLLFIFIVMLIMGMSSEYNRIFIAGGYCHFATEGIVTFCMLYSPKVAKTLSGLLCMIYFLEIVCWVPFGDFSLVKNLFFLQFGFSDSFSALTAFSLVINKSTSIEMRQSGFAILIHIVGVSIAMVSMPFYFFDQSSERSPKSGIGWTMLAYAGFPQMYFLRDALQSKYNESKHLISFPVWLQIVAPIVCCVFSMTYAFVMSLSTAELPSDIARLPFWQSVMEWTFWPLGVIGILILLKIKFVGI